jgi:putative Mn2+ efflux pump MntP
MEVWKLFLLGVVIGSNNLAVAFTLGALDVRYFWWRIIAVFGVFEFVIPLVGIFIGQHFSEYIADYATYVGGGILLLFGLFMVYKSFNSSLEDEEYLLRKVTSWAGIISLATGLSLDNLIVGFSIGLQNFHPLTTAAVIAFSSIVFTFIGLNTGKYLKEHFKKSTDLFSAVLLIMLGVATLLEWL